MDKYKHKQEVWRRKWEDESTSSTIGERFPHVKRVEVNVTRQFLCAFFKKEESDKRTLTTTSKMSLIFDCLNGDCTGYGFNLTQELWTALLNKSEIHGEKVCDGKEDWKYRNSVGNSCQSKIVYTITPKYE